MCHECASNNTIWVKTIVSTAVTQYGRVMNMTPGGFGLRCSADDIRRVNRECDDEDTRCRWVGNMATKAPVVFGVWCTSDDIRSVTMKTPGRLGIW